MLIHTVYIYQLGPGSPVEFLMSDRGYGSLMFDRMNDDSNCIAHVGHFHDHICSAPFSYYCKFACEIGGK